MARAKSKRRFGFTLRQWQAMVFGSDRPGHLFAASMVAAGFVGVGIWLAWPWLVGVGYTVLFWEWFATPDVDMSERRSLGKGDVVWRFICLMWRPYGAITPHRSKFSHSLAIGLPCRLGYCVAVLWGLSWLGWSWPYDWAWGDAWALWNDYDAAGAILLFLSRWTQFLVGAAIADATHLMKDSYTVEQMIWGKK
jgi:uncharacterized metal-binding protein